MCAVCEGQQGMPVSDVIKDNSWCAVELQAKASLVCATWVQQLTLMVADPQVGLLHCSLHEGEMLDSMCCKAQTSALQIDSRYHYKLGRHKRFRGLEAGEYGSRKSGALGLIFTFHGAGAVQAEPGRSLILGLHSGEASGNRRHTADMSLLLCGSWSIWSYPDLALDTVESWGWEDSARLTDTHSARTHRGE